MNILALSTSTNKQLIVLRTDDDVYSFSEDAGRQHEPTLLNNVLSVLKRANLEPKDINKFIVDIGPGSYTGIRIGMSLILTWGMILDRPVQGISSFDILQSSEIVDLTKPTLIGINARRGNVFGRLLTPGDETLERHMNLLDFEKNVKGSVAFYSENLENYAKDIVWEKQTKLITKEIEMTTDSLSKVIEQNLEIANDSFTSVKPKYLRKTEAEQNLREDNNGIDNVTRVE